EEAKGWIAEQRLMHGLLRAMHTADAPAREGRIATLLERIDREARLTPRRQWVRVLAAALVLACVGVWFVLPASLPTANAAVERAVKELARDVNRRFRLEVLGAGNTGAEFLLVTHPGNRFRVDGKIAFGKAMIEVRLGCDGQEVWWLSTNIPLRDAFPFAERERQRMPVLHGALDLGYLDVHNLLQKLTEEFDVSVVDRVKDAKGESRLRLAAQRRGASGRPRSLRLQCDEETGMVTRIEIDDATGTLRFEYLGEEPAPFVNYQRPWK
ncbi:MAG TPA: hypothetical protein VFT55_15115, partial [Planctomycetota bacterium]|nr:hypothetical protein [Planctomycetota bacterium]